jgi:hypothetical protein
VRDPRRQVMAGMITLVFPFSLLQAEARLKIFSKNTLSFLQIVWAPSPKRPPKSVTIFLMSGRKDLNAIFGFWVEK